jgi:hypothetical protein
MAPRNRSQRTVIFQIGEGDELRNIDFVRTAGFGIGDVGKPFQLSRNVGQITILFRRQYRFAIDTSQLVCHRLPVAVGSNSIMDFIELVVNR